MRLYYAQNREDLLIKSFFPDIKEGFYIDVGANDPIIDSVTKIFYDSGWSGINIEPIEKHIKDLKSQRKRDINLQIGIGNKPGKVKFRQYLDGDGLSTFDLTMQKDYENSVDQPTKNFKDYSVSVRTLSDVIREHKVEHIHFMKIDVEGYEYEVLDSYDWKNPRPELLCIEANHIKKDWRPITDNHNYRLVFFDGVNNYYLAEEAINRLDHFNYPNAVFAGNPIYFPAYSEAETVISERLRAENMSLKDSLRDKEQQIALLNWQQRDVRFLAKRLALELEIRLNKKARGNATVTTLAYAEDSDLRLQAEKSIKNRQESLEFIQRKDRKNIYKKNAGLKSRVFLLFWKIIAITYRISMKFARRLSGF